MPLYLLESRLYQQKCIYLFLKHATAKGQPHYKKDGNALGWSLNLENIVLHLGSRILTSKSIVLQMGTHISYLNFGHCAANFFSSVRMAFMDHPNPRSFARRVRQLNARQPKSSAFSPLEVCLPSCAEIHSLSWLLLTLNDIYQLILLLFYSICTAFMAHTRSRALDLSLSVRRYLLIMQSMVMAAGAAAEEPLQYACRTPFGIRRCCTFNNHSYFVCNFIFFFSNCSTCCCFLCSLLSLLLRLFASSLLIEFLLH